MSEEKPVIRNTAGSALRRAARALPTAKPANAGPASSPAAKSAKAAAAAAGPNVAARPKPPSKAASAAAPAYSPAEIRAIFERFRGANPEPKGELDSVNAFTLLVAVVLSAQATDVGVNKATKELFRLADTPEKLVALGEDRVRELIKTIGLYRMKAKNVVALAAQLIERFGGEVPTTREDLVTLPGVGRKTANVVLNGAFGASTIAVDTHLFRLGNRLGLAPGRTPDEVEAGLEAIIPDDLKRHAHHWLILHGRYVCKARRPDCERCIIADLCKFDGKSTEIPFPLPAN